MIKERITLENLPEGIGGHKTYIEGSFEVSASMVEYTWIANKQRRKKLKTFTPTDPKSYGMSKKRKV